MNSKNTSQKVYNKDSPDFTEKFLRFIIDEVIRHHERAAGR